MAKGMPKIRPLFRGEWMTCGSCNKKQKSDPTVESGWTAVYFDSGKPRYICPECWDEAIANENKRTPPDKSDIPF